MASPAWYHSIDLPDGTTTPGWFDLRALPARLPLPVSTAGMRCLDVGTFEGFWAFELERRGSTDVTAIDVLDPAGWDWPAGSTEAMAETLNERKRSGSGFEPVHAALGSRVRREERSVYDLSPERDGWFDLVYVGSLLLHLRDPVRALAAVRSVCRGQVLSVDAIDLPLSLLAPRRPLAGLDGVARPWWWRPNRAGLVRMQAAAGLSPVQPPRLVWLAPGAGHPRARSLRAVARGARSRSGRETLWASRFGAPHLATLTVPTPP